MTEPGSNFYKKAAEYWAKVPSTLNGVLGGYEHISGVDIAGSKAFLQYLFSVGKIPSRNLALDCGAGIGRVSKLLLIPHFEKVDLVEQDSKFIETAKTYIGESEHLGTLYNVPLQEFNPSKKYDLIWCQWVLGSIKDIDLILFMERCRDSLTDNGVIVVKENISAGDRIDYDEDDSSVTRPYKLMALIFHEAKLNIFKERIQSNFPDEIYTVMSFALTPVTCDDAQ